MSCPLFLFLTPYSVFLAPYSLLGTLSTSTSINPSPDPGTILHPNSQHQHWHKHWHLHTYTWPRTPYPSCLVPRTPTPPHRQVRLVSARWVIADVFVPLAPLQQFSQTKKKNDKARSRAVFHILQYVSPCFVFSLLFFPLFSHCCSCSICLLLCLLFCRIRTLGRCQAVKTQTVGSATECCIQFSHLDDFTPGPGPGRTSSPRPTPGSCPDLALHLVFTPGVFPSSHCHRHTSPSSSPSTLTLIPCSQHHHQPLHLEQALDPHPNPNPHPHPRKQAGVALFSD